MNSDTLPPKLPYHVQLHVDPRDNKGTLQFDMGFGVVTQGSFQVAGLKTVEEWKASLSQAGAEAAADAGDAEFNLQVPSLVLTELAVCAATLSERSVRFDLTLPA